MDNSGTLQCKKREHTPVHTGSRLKPSEGPPAKRRNDDRTSSERTDPENHGFNPDLFPNAPRDDSGLGSQDSTSAYNQNTIPITKMCFGMICDVAIRFRQDSALNISDMTTTRVAADGSVFLVLDLVSHTSYFELLCEHELSVATINTKTFDQLSSLHELKSLTLEGVLPKRAMQTLADLSGYIKAGTIAAINLNVYGDPQMSDDIARELGRNKLFLQDPESVPEDIYYSNPQDLELPAHAISELGADNCVQVGPVGAAAHPPKAGGKLDGNPTADNFDLDLNFDQLLDSFAQHDDLLQASVDSRVQTPLLDHQKEGLNFVLRRESRSSRDKSLWGFQDSDSTQPPYQHLITGARSEHPVDTRGGILADDMGLGKSLIMISAIIGSLSSALDYAVSLTSKPGEGSEVVLAAKSTLVILPSALLIDNWIEQINSHTMLYTIACCKYHGHSRGTDVLSLLDHDVILTTYGTVAADFKHKHSLLHNVRWYRVVLDEAHVIRNATTNQFKAVSALESSIRWCLTGTPIQNTLNDLGSLVSFLKVPILRESAQFRRHIIHQTHSSSSGQQPHFENLRILLGAICLRRNKSILSFPSAVECVHKVEFSATETEAYHQLRNASREAIDLAVSGHRSRETHQTILEALLRMRIFCNNGDFLKVEHTDLRTEPEELGSLLQQMGEAVCNYCMCDVLSFGQTRDSGSGVVTKCRSVLCSDCISRYEKDTGGLGFCVICKASHASPVDNPDGGAKPDVSDGRPFPSKLMALCEDIERHRNGNKNVVFSFWRRSLDIVCSMFNSKNIPYLRVDGTLPLGQRRQILKQFQAVDSGVVLLITLGTGAVGLNDLSVANRIHILEPQWNPSVESQAIGRVVRLGQTKAVQVVRYIVKDTVEGNVQNGQLRKLQLAKNGFGAGESIHFKQRTQMLKDLICSNRIFE